MSRRSGVAAKADNHSDISPSLKSTICERPAADYRTRRRPSKPDAITLVFSDLKRTEDGRLQKSCKTSLSTLITNGPCDSRRGQQGAPDRLRHAHSTIPGRTATRASRAVVPGMCPTLFVRRMRQMTSCTLCTTQGTDLVALDNALTAVTAMDERKGKVVELRFSGGLRAWRETATVLRVSPETVMRDGKFAKAWPLREVS